MGNIRKHHPLVLYHRQLGAWRAPAFLIAGLCGLLAWQAPAPFDSPAARMGLLLATGIATLLFAYTVLGPRLAYVQCRPTHLLVSTPVFRLAISYSRIRTARPVPFHPASVPNSQRWLVEPFLRETAIALDLTGYPVRRRWLRLWLGDLMVPPGFMGLILLTPDWLTLSRDLEACRSAWKTRRRDRERAHQETLTTLIGPRVF